MPHPGLEKSRHNEHVKPLGAVDSSLIIRNGPKRGCCSRIFYVAVCVPGDGTEKPRPGMDLVASWSGASGVRRRPYVSSDTGVGRFEPSATFSTSMRAVI